LKIPRNKIRQLSFSALGIYLLNWYFPVVLLIVLGVTLLFYFMNVLVIEKDMLFWLFGATSQSMAALFAVVGMFAVFRYQDMQTRLRNLYDSLKIRFTETNWVKYFGQTEAYSWDDFAVVPRAKHHLEEKESKLPKVIKRDLGIDIKLIENHELVRNNIRIYARTPLTAILITFMLSIISLPSSAYLSESCLGLAVLIIMMILITFSMTSIFKYFMISIPKR